MHNYTRFAILDFKLIKWMRWSKLFSSVIIIILLSQRRDISNLYYKRLENNYNTWNINTNIHL